MFPKIKFLKIPKIRFPKKNIHFRKFYFRNQKILRKLKIRKKILGTRIFRKNGLGIYFFRKNGWERKSRQSENYFNKNLNRL